MDILPQVWKGYFTPQTREAMKDGKNIFLCHGCWLCRDGIRPLTCHNRRTEDEQEDVKVGEPITPLLPIWLLIFFATQF